MFLPEAATSQSEISLSFRFAGVRSPTRRARWGCWEAPAYLARVQHVSDGSSAQVSCGDDVLLPTRVPSSHCLCGCHGDSFRHADELLGCGGPRRGVGAVEHLQRAAEDELPEAAAWSSCGLTVSSCLMCSMVASKALVPLVASSSTAFTVFRRDVTLVTITCSIRASFA